MSRLQREVGLIVPTASVVRAEADLFREASRSARAARGYTNAWLGDVLDAQEAGARNPYAVATTNRAKRLAVGAATENAEAFSRARERALVALDPIAAAQMVKVWDAALDKRTCPRCEHAHGSWVPVGEDFPEGTPGGMHANCRCAVQIIPADWAEADYYARAA